MIASGDRVTWKNDDDAPHRIERARHWRSFRRGVLDTKSTILEVRMPTRSTRTSARYTYAMTGNIVVTESRFERVVLPHLDAAYTLARYLTRDVTEAEDATQEAILRAVRYFGTLRSEEGARAWLLAIVRRECYGC